MRVPVGEGKGSREEIIRGVSRIMKGHSGINAAIVFGSVAGGDFSPESDIDIAVEYNADSKGEKYDIWSELDSVISEMYNRNVDLIDIEEVNPAVRYEVFTFGQFIAGRERCEELREELEWFEYTPENIKKAGLI